MATHSTQRPAAAGGGTIALWAGVIGVPTLWGVQFQLQYALVPWVCASHKLWVLRATTAVSIALAMALLAAGWFDYRRSFRAPPDNLETGPHARGRFLGALGLLVATMFALVIAAQGLPSFFIDPCLD